MSTIFSRISYFFTVNQALSWLILVSLLVFGAVAFYLTPKQYNPEIERPAFLVTTEYAGASIVLAEEQVLYELVEKINAVPGVDEITSVVRDGAQIQTTVIFDVGYDAVQAKVDLLTQLEQHSYRVQGFINPPSVMEINPETIPIVQIVFSSDTVPVAELRDVVTRLRSELVSVPGVSEIVIVGGYQPGIVVAVDPVSLAAQSLQLSDIETVLRNSQLRTVYPGSVGEWSTDRVFMHQVTAPEDVGRLPINDTLLLRDVAAVYRGPATARSYVLHQSSADNGKEVVMLGVAKKEGTNALTVSRSVLELLEERMGSQMYNSIQMEVVSDDGVTAGEEIYGLTKNLLVSISIVGVVLFLFLSARAAFVVLVTVPLTFLVVFGLGYVFDQTINRITLFALILSLGLLVDAAIVVTENIYRKLETLERESERAQVVAAAVQAVGMGLLLSLITSVIVFTPMRFITGMMGPYMGPIAFFVPAALIVSFFVAIALTPFLSFTLLRGDAQPIGPALWVQNKLGWVIEKYQQKLRSILYSRKKQRLVLRTAFIALLVSFVLPLFAFVHFQMLPGADRDQIYVYADLPVSSGVESTKRVAEVLSGILLVDEDIHSTQSFVGQAPIVDFNGLFKGVQNRVDAHQFTMRVNFTPGAERKRSSGEIVSDIRHLLSVTDSFDSVSIRIIEEPPGPPTQATLVAKLFAPTHDERVHLADSVATVLSGVDGAYDIHVGYDEAVSRIAYRYDPVVAAEYGVSPQAVQNIVSTINNPWQITKLMSDAVAEHSALVMVLPTQYREQPDLIQTLLVSGTDGRVVPFSQVVDTEYVLRPSYQSYEGAQDVLYITASTEGRSIVYVMIDLIWTLLQSGVEGYSVTSWGLFSMTLEDDSGQTMVLHWGGEWEMTLENFRDLGIAMTVALLLVYAVLVAQYRRFSVPAFLLVTVPLGLIGILWGFTALDQLFGIYLTATALIGFIALIGIVVNNAIIYLEYVSEAQAVGHSYREALIEAGGVRFRPIVLTSLTTIMGSLTIAFDPVWSGLAWAIVFGLSFSTVLTLFIYPILLTYYTTPDE